MTAKIFGNADGQNVTRRLFFSFHRCQGISLLVIVVILSVVSVGLRIIFQKLVLNEAEQDAVQISTAIRDSEISRFFWPDGIQKQFLSISPQRLSELDNNMRSFLVPFEIVKIKVSILRRELFIVQIRQSLERWTRIMLTLNGFGRDNCLEI